MQPKILHFCFAVFWLLNSEKIHDTIGILHATVEGGYGLITNHFARYAWDSRCKLCPESTDAIDGDCVCGD